MKLSCPLAALLLLWASSSYAPLSQYTRTPIEGWTFYIHRDYFKPQHKKLSHYARTIVKKQLRECRRVLPPKALKALQKVPIWLEYTGRCKGNSAVYRRGTARALKAHGLHPLKANAIELCGAKRLFDTAYTMPAHLLHELSHAYLLRELTPKQIQQIQKAYRHAKKKGLYRKVKMSHGPPKPGYALRNYHEYFAEATESFFGRNNAYPFVRKQLKSYDPHAYRMIRALWGVKRAPKKYRIGYGYRWYKFKK